MELDGGIEMTAPMGSAPTGPEPVDCGGGKPSAVARAAGCKAAWAVQCEKCGGEVRRSQRRSGTAYALSCISVYPFRCQRCLKRTFRVHWGRLAVLAGLITGLSLAVTGIVVVCGDTERQEPRPTEASRPAVHSIPPVEAMSNEDVVDLSKVRMNTEIIMKLIRSRPHRFRVDPRSLISLKEAGTADDVIMAIVEVTRSSLGSAAAPQEAAQAEQPREPNAEILQARAR